MVTTMMGAHCRNRSSRYSDVALALKRFVSADSWLDRVVTAASARTESALQNCRKFDSIGNKGDG